MRCILINPHTLKAIQSRNTSQDLFSRRTMSIKICKHMRISAFAGLKIPLNHHILLAAADFHRVDEVFAFSHVHLINVARFISEMLSPLDETLHYAKINKNTLTELKYASQACNESKLTEKAFKNTKHWMIPSIVSPVKQNVPLKWRPFLPKTVDNEACTIARRLLADSEVVTSAFELVVIDLTRLSHDNRSSDSIIDFLLNSWHRKLSYLST